MTINYRELLAPFNPQWTILKGEIQVEAQGAIVIGEQLNLSQYFYLDPMTEEMAKQLYHHLIDPSNQS